MRKILYIGRFELPDKEATANRVVANAKLLRECGYDVTLAGWSADVGRDVLWAEAEWFGFRCYEKHKAANAYEKYRMFSDAAPEITLLKRERYDAVIAYDFPAVALKKIMKHCRKEGIRVICDVSEWYTNHNKNPLFRLVRAYDSYLRMKKLHRRADGLIVISRYLQDYYRDRPTVLVPPLVDMTDEKWIVDAPKMSEGRIQMVYAGWPSKTKERLDVIVEAVAQYPDDVQLHVYGIDQAKYQDIYAPVARIPDNVVFHGRVSHREAVQAVKAADYSVIIRESCRKNNAGFPSKMVESISCGTPVLITNISNVADYVGDGHNGYLVTAENFASVLGQLCTRRPQTTVDRYAFDYHGHMESIRAFLEQIGVSS